jgi:hypothetical protein
VDEWSRGKGERARSAWRSSVWWCRVAHTLSLSLHGCGDGGRRAVSQLCALTVLSLCSRCAVLCCAILGASWHYCQKWQWKRD